MSYLFVVAIGAVTGFVVGRNLKGSELGVGVDFAAGAVGACVAVVLSRFMGPAAAAGFVMSFIVAVIGAIGALFAFRRFMKVKPVPVTRARRRT